MAQLFFQQSFFIFVAAGVLAVAALFWLVIDIRMKWKSVFGKSGLSGRAGFTEGKLLEDLLRRVKSVEGGMISLESRVVELEGIGRASIQKAGFLRFNPFSSTGGDQSFSLALLDGKNDGVIISSLYSREGTRTYAKAVKVGRAIQQLSEEERKVLEEALRG
ncbi:MAG: DUF4446 family protein [Parcubacteria group bacterium]|nr:DUF4446 family protein [Parcubacteria group bacterium]